MLPAIALVNPKYPANVGNVVRAASIFGIPHVWITGDRVPLEPHPGYRLPREERMKAYKSVTLERENRFFDRYPRGTTFVAVEVKEGSESLVTFDHPENAVYVFGPEDGSLARVHYLNCHRFIHIPTVDMNCLNLAAAVNVVLYDRMLKQSLVYA